MKKRVTALIILLALVLSACTMTLPTAPTEAPTEATARPKPTETEAPTEAPETTEAPTEAPTEATEEPAQDLDVGTVDGNVYRNETLNLSATFPEGWYVYNETDIAALNNLVESGFDDQTIAAALESSQAIVIFCASQPASLSSVNITVSKNQMFGMSEEAIISLSLPLIKAQLEQTGVMQNVSCEAGEADFCGQKHTVLNVTGETAGIQLHETLVYLSFGNLLYNVVISSAQESTVAEVLNLFEPIG